MKITVNFSDGVANLPLSAAKCIKSATREELASLLAALSDARAFSDFDSCADDIASAAGVSRAELESSLSFWRGAGVISIDGAQNAAENSAPRRKLSPKRESPELSGRDVEAIVASSPERVSLLNECQQTLGHVFNNAESAVVLSMREYLGLEDEYILLLLAYCAKRGKTSVKYAEKMAYSLYDRGIETSEALEEYLTWLESSLELEGRFRKLAGLGSRAFSKKEREYFERWAREFGYSYDMIDAAYSATVNAIGKFSMPYMNKILESWHNEGYKTPEDAAARSRKDGDGTRGGFDTDDFFEMAVRRGISGGGSQ